MPVFSVCEHDLAQKCLWTALTCLEVGPELRELFLPLRIGNPLYVLAVRHCTGCEMMKVSGRHAPLPLCPPHTMLLLLAWGHTVRTTDLNNYSEFLSWHRTPSCLRLAYTQVQVLTIMYHGQFTDHTLKRCVSENGTQ